MSKLVINEEGFVDLRSNPPATRVQVQGGTEGLEEPRRLPVETVPEPPAIVKDEVLPGRQKDTEGLVQSHAGPVKVPLKKREIPHRLESSSGEKCYAIVSKSQFQKLSVWHWIGTKTGHMYRRVKQASGEKDLIIWLHRESQGCNRADRFIGFLDGDERNLLRSNIRIVGSKEEAKAIRLAALQRSTNG